MDFMNWNVQALHLWILSGSRLTLVYLIHMLVQLLYFLYFIHMSSYIKALPLPFICEAQTRHLWGAAPAYDAWGTPLPAHSAVSCRVMPRGFFFKSRLAPTRLRLGPIRAELGWLRLESAETAETADSGRNSKKKKKCKTHRLN